MNVDIEMIGKHCEGLLEEEIKKYLCLRYEDINKKKCYGYILRKLLTEFKKLSKEKYLSGLTQNRTPVMYRWEVEMFSDIMFKKYKTVKR